MTPPDDRDDDGQDVVLREDFVPSMQCPCCNMFFGMYLATPVNAPTQPPTIAVVPPDKVQETQRKLVERWRDAGTLSVDGGEVVELDPSSTN